MKLTTEKTISSETIFEGRVVHLVRDEVELENGKITTREIVKHPGGACVLAITDENKAVMVRQFRYAHKIIQLEIPAGKLEYGEDPKLCGIRELKEETGYEAGSFEYFGKMIPTGAYVGEVIHIYLARELRKTEQMLDEDEFLEIVEIPFENAVNMALSGEITDGKTQVALLKAWILFNKDAQCAPM
ncbi:MAG: NUDIX hydrolase [Oscillospiraceae bacterium]|jgi:ADP-ribose pyrophosphatase|nr:NUDIX hydrolase [Oscillospiraceae bacterium]